MFLPEKMKENLIKNIQTTLKSKNSKENILKGFSTWPSLAKFLIGPEFGCPAAKDKLLYKPFLLHKIIVIIQ